MGLSTDAALAPPTASGLVDPEGSDPTRPCPYCGEAILLSAKKCRFCNEFLDPSLRAAKQHSPDDDLETSDLIFCLICSGIACIVGLIYAIQGKKKGWKMMVISFFMSIFWNIVFGILGET